MKAYSDEIKKRRKGEENGSYPLGWKWSARHAGLGLCEKYDSN